MDSFRSKQTKDLLKTTFLDKMLLKPNSRITVKDICDEIGCSRKTFYRYFETSYDIHLAVMEDLLFWLEPIFMEVVIGIGDGNMEENYEKVKGKSHIYKKLVDDEVFRKVFTDKSRTLIDEVMSEANHYKPSDPRYKLLLEAIVSNIYIIFRWSIINGVIGIENTRRNVRELFSDEMLKCIGLT